MFLIQSATINMYNVSDEEEEEIDIDYSVMQTLNTMNISVDGK